MFMIASLSPVIWSLLSPLRHLGRLGIFPGLLLEAECGGPVLPVVPPGPEREAGQLDPHPAPLLAAAASSRGN